VRDDVTRWKVGSLLRPLGCPCRSRAYIGHAVEAFQPPDALGWPPQCAALEQVSCGLESHPSSQGFAGVVLRFTSHQAGLAHVGHPAKGLWVMVIRIGTWNLENLFRPPNPFAPKTEQEYHAKLDALASAITRMYPMCWRCRRPHRDRGQQPLRVAVSWWRFRLHGWVIQRVWGQRLAASAPLTRRTPGGSPDVENTAQPRVRRLSTLLAKKKVAVRCRPSVAMVG
jgi:hypothetical protein